MLRAPTSRFFEFKEEPPGNPEAIYAWFCPDLKTGHEFVYPRSEAMRPSQGEQPRSRVNARRGIFIDIR